MVGADGRADHRGKSADDRAEQDAARDREQDRARHRKRDRGDVDRREDGERGDEMAGDEGLEEYAMAHQCLQRHVPVPAHGIDHGEHGHDPGERRESAYQALAGPAAR